MTLEKIEYFKNLLESQRQDLLAARDAAGLLALPGF